MKVALFATATPGVIAQTIDCVREHFDTTDFTVYVRDSYRPELEGALQGVNVESDYLRGRTLSFLKNLRTTKYDSLAVILGGGRDHWKMKAMAFVSGTRHLYVFNEHGGFFEWNRQSLPIIRQHLAARFREGRSTPNGGSGWVLYALARAYGLTLGPVMGAVVLLAQAVWLELRRVLRFGPRSMSS